MPEKKPHILLLIDDEHRPDLMSVGRESAYSHADP